MTIGQKLTTALITLGLALAAISFVVVDHVGRMRDDVREVYEEAREATLASRLVSELHAARVLVEIGVTNGRSEVAIARIEKSLATVQVDLRRFSATSASSAQEGGILVAHEQEEQRLLAAIQTLLEATRAQLQEVDPKSMDPKSIDPKSIAELERLAEALAETTRARAIGDQEDLESLAEQTKIAIWGTATACAVALVVLSLGVSRLITRPLRLLRAGADRIGEGDLGHRIGIPSRDEIGDLARAFDRMAERVATSHANLEDRVRARTAQFLRAAKLADLGTLAAGFAHEINNPLASIASSAEGLERRLARGTLTKDQQTEYLRTIASEAYRAQSITSSLVDLARQDRDEETLVDLRSVVTTQARLLEAELEKRGICLVLDLPAEIPPVHGNPQELTQALMNLVLNAKDASPDRGTITIKIVVTEVLSLTVTDEGPGIPEANLDRIFEPFFTTKPAGKGTGLGLALAHAIAERHRGSLEAANAAERGAVFTLTLPLARAHAP